MRAKVLVVEDSSLARCELRRCLEDNFEVVEAPNGADALNLASQTRFDLVVADVNMPVMGGIEFVRLLRGLPDWAAVPVIIVTAESGDEQVQRGRAAGVNAWIVKPVEGADLRAAVAQLLNSSGGSAT